MKNHILTLKENIEEEMHDHLDRWGGNYNNWENEIQVMINFGLNRVNYLRTYIRNQFNLNGIFALDLGVNPACSGKIKLNTIIPERYPWRGIYFDDIPVTLIPVPEPGYRFTGWMVKDSDDEHQFLFPSNTNIGAEDYLVVCRDEAAFVTLNPYVANHVGDFDFGLSSCGECIRLYDGSLRLVDSVFYGITSPWPPGPNGTGPTLELINPALDNTLPENWYASNTHGTPGAINESWSPLSIEEPDPGSDVNINLQVYPNPFHISTSIMFYLEYAEPVLISVCNLDGRIVRVLNNQLLPAGIVELTWDGTAADGTSIASGIYIIKLITPKQTYFKTVVFY